MPLYEYRCLTCGKTIEAMQKFSDAPLTVHQGCGGELERVISASAFQFKGKGWYVTDYGRGGTSPSNGDSPKAEGKTEGKADAKTANGSGTKGGPSSESKATGKAEKTAREK